MSECEHLTARRRWCKVPALPGGNACRHHVDDDRYWSVDDYRIADYHLVNEMWGVPLGRFRRRR